MLDFAAAYAVIKKAGSVLKEAGKLDLYQQVLDLQQMMVEAQQKNVELATENHRLHVEMQTLKDERTKLAVLQAMHFDGQVYWADNSPAADGPFCPKCKDGTHVMTRVVDIGNGYSHCVNCDLIVDNKLISNHGKTLSREPLPQPYTGGYDVY